MGIKEEGGHSLEGIHDIHPSITVMRPLMLLFSSPKAKQQQLDHPSSTEMTTPTQMESL